MRRGIGSISACIVVKNPNSDRVNDNESITIHLGRMSYFPTDVV